MNDKLLQRMDRLKAMAEDATSEHEAAIALRRLHSLLAKHNMEMSDLDREADPVNNINMSYYNRPWAKRIAKAIADLYFCHMYYFSRTGNRKTEFVITGRKHNREFALFLIQQTLRALDQEGRKSSRAYHGKVVTQFMNSFKNSAANRIMVRCLEMIDAAKQGQLEDDEGNTLPVLASLYDQESAAIALHLPDNLRTQKMRMAIRDAAGAEAGHNAGGKVQLSRAIQQDKAPKQLT